MNVPLLQMQVLGCKKEKDFSYTLHVCRSPQLELTAHIKAHLGNCFYEGGLTILSIFMKNYFFKAMRHVKTSQG